MLKKLFLFILCLFLIACSSIEEIPKKDIVRKNEKIKLAISNSKNEVILLGDNYDYQFIGEEATKLLTLADFQKIDGLASQVQKEIVVDESGSAVLSIYPNFKLYKSDKNLEKENEKIVNDFKKILKEKNIEYSVKEDEEKWNFFIANDIKIKGKVAKLANHDEILKKSSNQIMNLSIDLKEYYSISNSEYAGRVLKEKIKGVGEGILLVAVLPVAFAFAVVTLPLWIYAVSN